MINYFIVIIINLFNFILKKNKNRKVIVSFPDFDDMTRGLINNLSGEIIILSTVKYKNSPLWLRDDIKVIKKNSIKGIFYLITSSEIYFTHGLFSGFKKQKYQIQKLINVWHGMPLKNIGYLDGKNRVPECHKIMVTSSFFIKIMSDAFGVDSRDIIVSGLPRNQILLNESKNLFFLSKCKNILWLPTYRKSKVGDIRLDSNHNSLFGLKDVDLAVLNRFLIQHGIFLYVKPHPMASFYERVESLSNIVFINEDWLFGKGITLYELMSGVDELWTDFSSVFIDFMCTGKPIKFIADDVSDYKKMRGFVFDIDKFRLPGVFISSFDELLNSIHNDDNIAYDLYPFIDVVGFTMPNL